MRWYQKIIITDWWNDTYPGKQVSAEPALHYVRHALFGLSRNISYLTIWIFFLDVLIFFYFLLEKFFRDLIRDQIRDQSLDLIRGPIRGPVRYLVQSGPVRSCFSRPVSLLFPVFRKSAAAVWKCENICSGEWDWSPLYFAAWIETWCLFMCCTLWWSFKPSFFSCISREKATSCL